MALRSCGLNARLISILDIHSIHARPGLAPSRGYIGESMHLMRTYKSSCVNWWSSGRQGMVCTPYSWSSWPARVKVVPH
eukprot:COSAG02_NODE_3806_length_6203_cov_175.828637_4_plen_79_part_00